jgi:DNA-binding MarR family transcriptional regulator
MDLMTEGAVGLELRGADVVAHGEATEVADTVGRVKRAIRHRMRLELGRPSLSEAQLELIRLVRLEPGLRVQDAAAGLGLAPNTVSTLVKQLAAAGSVERRPDRADGRVTRLFLTRAARARWALRRDRRERVVRAALGRLTAGDRAAIAGALPALNRLVQVLEEGVQDATSV